MPKYLCLQRSLDGQGCDEPSGDTSKADSPSSSEMQDLYAKFSEWQTRFEDHLVDLGGRLGDGTLVRPEVIETDGPSIEIKELIGGYMIVSADSLEQAVEVASACPGLVRPGSGVEVIEIRSP